MEIEFTKMHGLGNDFVVIDAISQEVDLSENEVRMIADRHFGIGCDQLLLVEASEKESVDFVIFTDRSIMAQAEANGIRAKIERSGARLYQDACPVMFPHRLRHGSDKVFATDSAKMIRLIRGAGKPSWYFGSLIDLIKAAQTGQFIRTI